MMNSGNIKVCKYNYEEYLFGCDYSFRSFRFFCAHFIKVLTFFAYIIYYTFFQIFKYKMNVFAICTYFEIRPLC